MPVVREASLESILEPLGRIEIVVPPGADARKVFSEVAALYDNRKVELTTEHHIIVMPPTGMEGGYASGEVFGQLRDWAKRDGTGKAFDSSAGFYIRVDENRSPDAAWVRNERIRQISKADRKTFAPFCPDFAIEVKSPANGLGELRRKCRRYVECGAFAAWLIDPETRTVEIYEESRGAEAVVLQDAATITGSGPLASFVLELREIWAGL
jgi:Uma2 family endonuclease